MAIASIRPQTVGLGETQYRCILAHNVEAADLGAPYNHDLSSANKQGNLALVPNVGKPKASQYISIQRFALSATV